MCVTAERLLNDITARHARNVIPDNVVVFRLGQEARMATLENAKLNIYIRHVHVRRTQARVRIAIRVLSYNETTRRYEFKSNIPEITRRIRPQPDETDRWYTFDNVTSIVNERKNRPPHHVLLHIFCTDYEGGNGVVIDPSDDRVSCSCLRHRSRGHMAKRPASIILPP